jgi:hypothetical protein
VRNYLSEKHFMLRLTQLLLGAFAVIATTQPTAAQSQMVDVAAARASLSGEWTGTLEYLDYSANEWFGIPVKTQIEDQGDKATTIRRSDFDDGPTVGNVRITTVELFDAAANTVTTGSFRKGRSVDIDTYNVRMEGVAQDPMHWVMVEEVLGKDNKRPALLRYTTTRNGDSIETLKQVDFQDDDTSEWMMRNRTRMTRSGVLTAEAK